MFRYILVRIMWIFITLFAILTMVFFVLKLAPQYPPIGEDDVLQTYYEGEVKAGLYTKEYIAEHEEVKKILELKRVNSLEVESFFIYETKDGDEIKLLVYKPVSVGEQYFTWISNIVTKWDWGKSTKMYFGVDAFSILSDKMAVTMKLNLIALVFFIPVGLLLGTAAALKKDKLFDHIITIFIIFFISVPTFVTTTIFLDVIGYRLEWVPTQYPKGDVSFKTSLLALIIPIFGLSMTTIANITRRLRAELSETLTSDFLLLARTKGLSKRQSVIRHAMRNSFVPIIPYIITAFIAILSGSLVIERIYGIPGTGSVYINALEESDYNVLMVTTAFYTVISLSAGLIVDLSYGIVDPRIRMGGRK